MKRIICQAVVICAISAALGIAYNSFSNSGIPLFSGPPKPSDQFPGISLEEAKMKLESGQAIFVDARSKDEFIAGHIRGAINLPYDDFEIAYQEAVSVLIPIEKEIITYCGGQDCQSRMIVAENLKLLGHTKVRIFSGGWPAWVKDQAKN